MTFDAMSTAVDWLDAYRDGDIEAILTMYADDAVIECGCGGNTVITGREGLRAYWVQRLDDYPATDLDDLQPAGNDVSISYIARDGVVGATLEFNEAGKISYQNCGQLK